MSQTPAGDLTAARGYRPCSLLNRSAGTGAREDVIASYPSPATAWRAVVLLCLLYCLSFVDRMILSLLVAPIMVELDLSATQMGVLFGLSFAMLYTLAGLPLARVADGGDRRWLIVVGVVVWSAATALSGLASDYPMLLLARAGVAIGEAVLTPAAVSMIADLFPRERRAAPTSLYTAVGSTSGAAAFVIGGLIFQAATALSPMVGDMAPWRLTLVLVGLPGIVFALAFLALVREPARQEVEARASFGEITAHLRADGALYAGVFVGVSLTATVGYALLGWTPAVLNKVYGLDTAQAGYLFGAIGVVAGLVGTLALPWLARRLDRGGRGGGLLTIGAVFVLLALPATIVAFRATDLAVFAPALTLALMTLLGVTLIPSLVVQQVTPGRQRAQVMSVYLLVASLAGLGVGPTVVGLLTDHVFGDRGTATAVIAVAAVALPLGAALLWSCRGRYARRLQTPQATSKPS
jgi:MFS family permease